MKAFGAELFIVPSAEGKTTPELIPRMMEKAKSLADSEDCYFTNQIHNPDIIVGHRNMGKELLKQVDCPIDAFCGGVGTAGMLMGVALELRNTYPDVRIVALEPASTAVISGGKAGTHDVEGIGIGSYPPLLKRKMYDEARGIDEQLARNIARRLARQEGVFAGTSTGLNVAGALQLAEELGAGKTVITVACDSGLKYLAGDLFDNP